MSHEAPQPRRLTINDPVSPEELARLNELDMVLESLARKNLALDQEKIKMLGASKRVSNEAEDLYRKILVDRGLPDDSIVDIDHKTGAIRKARLDPNGASAEARVPAPAAPTPAPAPAAPPDEPAAS